MRMALACAVFAAASLAGCDRSPLSNSALNAPGPDGATRLMVLVSNETSNDLSFLDAASGSVVQTLQVGRRPRGMALSPSGDRLYVAVTGSPRGGPNVDERTLPPPDRTQDGIALVDLARSRLIRKLDAGNDPEAVAVSPDGQLLAVANEDSAQASLIDAETGAPVARIGVGVEPEGVRFTPDGQHLYVTSEANDRIDVIEVQSRRVVTTIATGKRPRNVVFSSDGSRAYVSCEYSERVDVIDAHEHRPLTSVPIEGTPRALPMGLALDDSQNRLYVTLGRAGEVAVIDTRALRLIQRIDQVGARPWGAVLTPDGKTLYTANGPSNDVSLIDTASLRVVSRVAVGDTPWGLATVRVSASGSKAR